MKAISTVGVLMLKEGKVLLVRHGETAGHITGVYGLPAGRVEAGETEKEAAVREFKEETGLVTSDDELILNPRNRYKNIEIPRKDGTIQRFDFVVYTCNSYTGELRRNDETEPEWASLNRLASYDLLPNIKEIIEREIP